MEAELKQELTTAFLEENYRVVEEKQGAKGFIQWWSVIKKESLGKDLIIKTAESYDNIYLNGKKIN